MFEIGSKVLQKVMKNTHRMGEKLDEKWEGPFEVVEMMSEGCYKLKSVEGRVLKKLCNGALLKTFFSNMDSDLHSQSASSDATSRDTSSCPSPCPPPLSPPCQDEPCDSHSQDSSSDATSRDTPSCPSPCPQPCQDEPSAFWFY